MWLMEMDQCFWGDYKYSGKKDTFIELDTLRYQKYEIALKPPEEEK